MTGFRSWAWVALAGSGVPLLGCSERIQIPAGDHVLTYSCGSLRPHSVSDDERAVVGSHALALVRYAEDNGDDDAVRTMMGALASGETDTVERELVRLLCNHPEWASLVSTWRAGESEDASVPAAGTGGEVRELTLPELEAGRWVAPDTFRLSAFRGRWVYLSVFGSWCEACREEYPSMAGLAARFQEAGEDAPAIVGLLLNDSRERALGFLESHGGPAYPFAVLDQASVARWGITGAPMGFLIDPNGRLEGRCFGCQHGPLSVEALARRFVPLAKPHARSQGPGPLQRPKTVPPPT